MSERSKARWLVVVDYNLTRLGDVRILVDYAKARYGLKSLLIRHRPTPVDKGLVDRVLDLDPLAPDFLGRALSWFTPIRDQVEAVLPFSDNAVRTGAELARALGKKHDSPELAANAFSKSAYRRLERKGAKVLAAQGVFVPRSRPIRSLEELRRFASECPRGFVLKPSCEGNNRGVIKLLPGDSLEEAFTEVMPYWKGGLIAEEIIDFPEEYSFDGIGHFHWLTEKLSVTSRYPVEMGQIVPARKPPLTLRALERAGRAANLIVGQRTGPFHNEIKYDPLTAQAAVIEPNRRPAGMKIWHLAQRVYGVNLFHLWIDQLVGGLDEFQLGEPRGVAAIRQLRAPKDGKLGVPETKEFTRVLFDTIRTEMGSGEWFDFRLTARSGEWVFKEPRDNAGFIAEVCFFSTNLSVDVVSELSRFEQVWFRCIEPYIQQEVSSACTGIASYSLP